MYSRNTKTRSGGLLAIAAAGVIGAMLLSSAQAADYRILDAVTGTGDDSFSLKSSFGAAAGPVGSSYTANQVWSTADGYVSDPTGDYYAERVSAPNAGWSIKSPNGGTAGAGNTLGTVYTFPGQSLHLTKLGSTLQLKGGNYTGINANIVMEDGGLIAGANSTLNYWLLGSLTVNAPVANANGGISGTGRVANVDQTITISSDLKGAGILSLGVINTGQYVIDGVNNSAFSGTVRGLNPITLASSNAVGIGNLTIVNNRSDITNNTPLTISNANALNSENALVLPTTYKAANPPVVAMALSLATDVTVIESLTGVLAPTVGTADTLEELFTLYSSANGHAGETFGAVGSSATHQSAIFTGVGLLQIVPEPASLGLLGLCGLTVLRRRR